MAASYKVHNTFGTKRLNYADVMLGSPVWDVCTCLQLCSGDFLSIFVVLRKFFWYKTAKSKRGSKHSSETKEKRENAVIKGKVSASVIKLSGAAQSSRPFNQTTSDWETDEKRVLASLRTKEANGLIPPWNKCPLLLPS